jgi:tetratricopeptide (TPR) repeat protein
MLLSNGHRDVEIGEFFLYMSLFYFLLIKWDEQKKIKTANREQINFSRTIVKFSIFILCITALSTLITDLRGQPYGPGVTIYNMANGYEYAYNGFYKEAMEQYEKALGINSQDYSFLKNLKNADIETPPFAGATIFPLDINGDLRISLLAHPPSKITYELTLPERAFLSFGIALDPEAWSPDKGDGVLFELYVQDGGMPERVFSKYIDPKHNVADRKWHDEVVDLSRYDGKEVNLSFVTTPGFNYNGDFDWAWWSDPRLILIHKSLSK